ncbi:NB-ARC domains-containing protein [Tanacetum coccineum]
MKLRCCCNLTTTPDFSKITNLEELSLEGCVNLVSVHPSIGMLKKLVVLNLRDYKRLQNFPSRVEMDALKVLTLTASEFSNFTPHFLRWSRAVACGRSTSRVGSFLNINLTLLLTKRRFGGDGVIEARMLRFSSAPSSVKLSSIYRSKKPLEDESIFSYLS